MLFGSLFLLSIALVCQGYSSLHEKYIIQKRLEYLRDSSGMVTLPRAIPIKSFILSHAETILRSKEVALHSQMWSEFQGIMFEHPSVQTVSVFAWQADALEMRLWWEFLAASAPPVDSVRWILSDSLNACLRDGSNQMIVDVLFIARESAERFSRGDILILLDEFIRSHPLVHRMLMERQRVDSLAENLDELWKKN